MNGKEALTKLQVGCLTIWEAQECYDIIARYFEILDIIKTKECNIHALILHTRRFDSPSGYNALVGDKYKLTEQEYDLLKEVLL